MQLLLVFGCLIFAAWGIAYVKKSGMFEPYPSAEYLSDEEQQSRPLYQQLTGEEKAIYTALYRGISEHEEKIALPFEIDGETYAKLYCILEKQEGGLFYIDSTFYTAEKIRTAKVLYRNDSENDYTTMAHELEMIADNVVSRIPSSDFDKALYIHDYIVNNCSYGINEGESYDATAYGCLVEKSAHCEGYAKAFEYLAEKAGLECIVVTGTTDDGENHAWNQVEIDGNWYNVDVTWDDTDIESDKRHMYFLVNDNDFLVTHFAASDIFAPFKCVSTDESYFIKENLYISSVSDADDILNYAVANGEDFIELKFANDDVYSEFKSIYIEGEKIFFIIMESGSPILSQSLEISLKENEKERCMMIFLQ